MRCLEQAAAGEAVLGGAPVWHPQALAGFVGVSGAYDLGGALHSTCTDVDCTGTCWTQS